MGETSTVRKIELLAPAKNLSCGIAAIDHGADAVYIGGPAFSARTAAANSVEDIEKLVRHAHLFGAKVYVALNTIFNDEELEAAVSLSHKFYEVGADALIIQDTGLLQSEMPPIALHASTQMNNRTPARVRFWEEVGFEQIVLARELSLAQIKKIHQNSTAPLEFFVHGALCVSYSGQCYISEVMAGRSANRGECAQFCRHKFDLLDSCGKVVTGGQHLLSLKDLNLSEQVESLIDAGISSLKIEGRLKEENYVKNVTAYYRGLLDDLIERRSDLDFASSGRCSFDFVPDPEKSFNRGFTDYFTRKKRNIVADPRSPKSKGKFLGNVIDRDNKSFVVDSVEPVVNGDGVCFFDPLGELVGLRVNRVEGKRLFPKDGMRGVALREGMKVYRNADTVFAKKLQQSGACRKIGVELQLTADQHRLRLSICDVDGLSSAVELEAIAEKAKNPEGSRNTAMKQLRKTGDTPFIVDEVVVDLSPQSFYPASVFNGVRRKALANHIEVRLHYFKAKPARPRVDKGIWPESGLDYSSNILNEQALQFYLDHGVKLKADAFKKAAESIDAALMTTKYCIKAQLGSCPKINKDHKGLQGPLTLRDKSGEFALEFDCDLCEMRLGLQNK